MSEVHDYGSSLDEVFRFKFNGLEYSLKAAPSGAVSEYKDRIMSNVTYKKDGSRQIGAMDSAKFWLLAKCIYNAGNVLVNQQTLNTWPNPMIDDLFDRAKKFCGIKDETLSLRRKRLKKAFEEDGAPCTYEAMKEWVTNVADEELVEGLADMFEEDLEEEGKD